MGWKTDIVALLVIGRLAGAQDITFTFPSTFQTEITSTRITTTANQNTADPVASPTATGEPCAVVSGIEASYLSENPSATALVRIPAELAYACASSAPIVEDDATALIDGLSAMLQFQSTLDALVSPPAGYLLAGVDIVQELDALRDQVTSGAFRSEIDFETNLTTILARAHDGHLSFIPDGLTVFSYGNQVGPLVSVSADGVEVPEVYQYLEYQAYLDGQQDMPSPIQQINGVDIEEYLLERALNSSFAPYQDPDSAYNSYFWAPNGGEQPGPNLGIFVLNPLTYPGPTTTLRFANGTTTDPLDNFAEPQLPFDGVTDGESFYDAFLDARGKATSLVKRGDFREHTLEDWLDMYKRGEDRKTSPLPRLTTRQSGGSSPLFGYPDPEIVSADGAVSGYFLNQEGFGDVAVLLIQSFLSDPQDFQSTVRSFLEACRSNNKQRLVVDLSGNGGGNTILGYDTFKQLFPTIDPWGTNNFRAQDGYRALGSAATELLSDPSNERYAALAGINYFASNLLQTPEGPDYNSFEQFYGPVTSSLVKGQYTNLYRLNIDNPEFTELIGNITVSGYDPSQPLEPQPFESNNIIMLTDGQCSSTCAIFSHLMKWQGKVKSVALGGRPQTGPMQAVGGVKGTGVLPLLQLASTVGALYTLSDTATRRTLVNGTLGTILESVEYIYLRTGGLGQIPSQAQVNIQNGIAEGDRTITPLQFVYEAADCRMFYQSQHIRDPATVWNTVAAQAFGLNSTQVFSGCVKDSTNHPSSLSGNSKLYNNGSPTNVTADAQDYGIINPGDGDGNSASGLNRPIGLMVLGLLSAFCFLIL